MAGLLRLLRLAQDQGAELFTLGPLLADVPGHALKDVVQDEPFLTQLVDLLHELLVVVGALVEVRDRLLQALLELPDLLAPRALLRVAARPQRLVPGLRPPLLLCWPSAALLGEFDVRGGQVLVELVEPPLLQLELPGRGVYVPHVELQHVAASRGAPRRPEAGAAAHGLREGVPELPGGHPRLARTQRRRGARHCPRAGKGPPKGGEGGGRAA
mmetsp:Transcript_7628/g.20440  ORF Transcript_7628/g.20440 Transcript_7628/m.20440 type:complete len:214 (+) Transcript_7628:1630-2271(+)